MARIPYVAPFQPDQTGPSRISANPGMFDAQTQAKSRIGQSVSSLATGMADVGIRIKHATDSAYVVGAHAGLEAAQSDFETWTKTNPDTSKWQAKQEETVLQAKEKALQGSGNLGGMAKKQLTAGVAAWETKFNAHGRMLTAEQNINNANGTFQDAWNQAVAANDVVALNNIGEAWKSSGAVHPQRVENLKTAAVQKIASNVANARIDADPFSAKFDDIQNLTDTAKVSLQFRQSKLQSDTRRQTMASLLQMKDKLAPGATMPNPDDSEAVPELGGASIHEVAKHQQIDPKWVAKLYKPPVAFDAKTYTTLTSRIATANAHDLSNPAHPLKGELIAEVYNAQFQPEERNKLLADLEKKADLKSEVNTPEAQSFFRRAEQQRSAGVFLPPGAMAGQIKADRLAASAGAASAYASAAKTASAFSEDDMSEPAVAARLASNTAKSRMRASATSDHTSKELAGWESRASVAERDAEAIRYADYLSKMRSYFEKKPDATDVEAETYARELRRPYVMESVTAALAHKPAGKRRLVRQGGKVYDFDTREEVK